MAIIVLTGPGSNIKRADHRQSAHTDEKLH